MKIAFTTAGNDLQAQLDSRLGRCARFLIYDLESESFTLIENGQNLQAVQGAGIQAAETVLRSGADVLISGHCGPKAFKVLRAGGVAIYNAPSGTLASLLEQFRAGQLTEASSADVEGHW